MTTTDLLTFFQPGKDAGTAWTFSSPDATASREAWVYFPGGTDLSRFTSREIASEEQFNQLLAEIRTAVRERGGILADARVHNEIIKVNLSGAEMDGYVFPRRVLRLRVSGDPRFESIAESMDLTAGDHLVIPVSAAAQGKLEAFEAVCEGFPADVRSTLFNVIRRPSLEWRINRIEQILSRPPATQAEWEKSRLKNQTFLQKLAHGFMWRIPVGPIAATLLLLALAYVGYPMLGDAPRDAEAEETTGTTDLTDAAATTAINDPDLGENEDEPPAGDPVAQTNVTNPDNPDQPALALTDAEADLKESVIDLYGALKDTKDPALQQLYTSHFQNHQEDLFSKSPRSPGPWGIAKLQALKWNLLPSNDNTLNDVMRKARVKEVYQTEAAQKSLASEGSAVKLLAWGFCQSTGSAAMPETQSEPKSALQLPVNKECKELQPQDAIAGLKDLTEWVKKQKA